MAASGRGLACATAAVLYHVLAVPSGMGAESAAKPPATQSSRPLIPLVNGIVPPQRPVGTAVTLAMNFLKRADGSYVPGRIDGELAAYFSDAFMSVDGTRSTRRIIYPARLHGYFIRTFLRYYAYTGEREWLSRARDLADWNIAHSTPADSTYPHLAYSTFEKGSPAGHADKGSIQPDKAAFMAGSYLRLFESTGETRYREAAFRVATTLLRHQRADGSWPFRVIPGSGEIFQDRGGAPVFFVEFFEQMLLHEANPAYRRARDQSLAHLIERNVEKGHWSTYHEDVGVKPDTHISAEPLAFTARYLFRHASEHPEYLAMGRRILRQLDDRLVHTTGHGAAPAPALAEQTSFEHIMPGHTARYGAALAYLYVATGDETTRRRALSALHGVTYMQDEAGMLKTFFYDVKKQTDRGIEDRVWFSQHLYSVYHLLECMAVFPELAPAGENHLLDSTTSLRDVSYASGSISYSVMLPALIRAKLRAAPAFVEVAGQPLRRLERPPANNERGWHFDSATGLLTLTHEAGLAQIVQTGSAR